MYIVFILQMYIYIYIYIYLCVQFMVVEGMRQRGHDGPCSIQCWSIKEGLILSQLFVLHLYFACLV